MISYGYLFELYMDKKYFDFINLSLKEMDEGFYSKSLQQFKNINQIYFIHLMKEISFLLEKDSAEYNF